ncbi:MAG: hypothetical protein M3P06_11435 [Acidobacteriota bacterium]|nr:hypothetical protein [Acidobacteriota bacterium]
MTKAEPTMGTNYRDALESIQSQLDQLAGEVADNDKAQNRIKSIKKAVAEITPASTETETA